MVYGRRLGRPLSTAKRSNLELGTDAFSISLPSEESEKLHLPSLFPVTPKKIALEIGFGYGEHLLMKCQKYPDWGFIGCEPYVNGLSNLFQNALDVSLKNLRTYQGDANHLLKHLKPSSLDALYILFPDPWPKKRHNKRRIIQKQSMKLFADLLKTGGTLLIATDHEDYAEWIEKAIHASPHFSWVNKKTPSQAPDDWVLTRYQQKGVHEGRPPRFYQLERKENRFLKILGYFIDLFFV